MLAKQVWRMLRQPDSLLARRYKDKYFPSTSLLHARAGYRASWAWQGILAGRDLLIRGLRWQVGTGSSILVSDDNWLPTSTTPPSSPKLLPGCYPASPFVSSLIGQDTGEWCLSLLQVLFDVSTVKLILSIPLPQTSN
ncbi:unnamed protein product [Linum trigynum]|uniref:Uncharacterized protein n=1 Tax=Linum trigynum TaxID=586398 RepID=A0AAV2F8J8_9ROSI